MHTPRIAVACLLGLTLYANVPAVDGIAVSRLRTGMEWPPDKAWGGDIHRYRIKDSKVVSDKILYRSLGRCAAINLKGTMVAFLRTGNSGYHVSVVPVDSGALRDVATWPDDDEHSARGYLDWPRGDWIYYNRGGEGETGSRELYRVNVVSGQNEKVITFSGNIWQWQMTADARKMVIVVAGNQEGVAGYGVTTYALPGNGIINGQGACGAAPAPSGTYYTNLEDSEHSHVTIRYWDGSEAGSGTMRDINDNAADLTTLRYTCALCGGTVTAGVGMDQNRWSANSDKWLCLCMGWPGGNCGRFLSCGANQVVHNWVDKKSVRVSSNPRSCGSSSDAATCTTNVPDAFAMNEAGDFLVTAPLADINPDLRDQLDVRYRHAASGSPAMRSGGKLRITTPGMAGGAPAYSLQGRRVAGSAVAGQPMSLVVEGTR